MSENNNNNNQAIVSPTASALPLTLAPPPPPNSRLASRTRIYTRPAFFTSLRNRTLVHHVQHIDDLGRKHTMNNNTKRNFRFDECTLQMMDDPDTVIYRRLSETLGRTKPTEVRPNEDEEKLKLFEKYGPELVEFVKDKDGHLKSKFDKVFII